MVSINTNLSSLIAQNNLNKATKGLNQAIERLSTGYKINHAGDNAANYSIANDMTTKLGSYHIAQDNIASGIDLISTAQDTISLMQEHGSRIHSLITQAQNGTYGADSLSAINSEVSARVAEIARLYSNAEYNGISLFNKIELPNWAEELTNTLNETLAPTHNGFIAEVDTVTPYVTVTDPSQLASAIRAAQSASRSAQKIVGIANSDVLAELAKIVNGTDGYTANDCSGVTICLTEDIDLGAYCSAHLDADGKGGWTPIGTDYSKSFSGTFNGNGHKVSNLKINNPDKDYQGLFGYTNGAIKNIGVENVDIKGASSTGGLVGCCASGAVTNSYATGTVSGTSSTGGLVGCALGEVTNSYSTGTVSGTDQTGGLVGCAESSVTNSYATGAVSGTSQTGGLVGEAYGEVTNSYAIGAVTGTGYCAGGLVGEAYATVTNSYATGTVSGADYTGGLVGYAASEVTNSYATGTATGTGSSVHGLIGEGTAGENTFSLDDVNPSTLFTAFQVGINSDSSSQISVSTGFSYDISSLISSGAQSSNAYNTINTFLEKLSTKATELGAAQNRLESALESTAVNIENLTSSRSTIKDADVAEVSSDYIKMQILQQASATLLSTANQSPSIALQLI